MWPWRLRERNLLTAARRADPAVSNRVDAADADVDAMLASDPRPVPARAV
jgi:hypothetical protein